MALTKVSNSMLVQPVNHNILINPSFTVFQRAGTTASGAWGVEHNSTSYGPDRWRIRGSTNVGGTKVESSTEVDAATGINKLVVKHPRDATDPIKSNAFVLQRIEAVNIQGLYGKEMTFSFGYSDAGGSGIPKVWIGSCDSSANYKEIYSAIPTSLGDNRWTCTFTLSTTDGTIPDPSEEGMSVAIYPNEQNNAPDEWSVWETKLEVGSVVTPFIARQYGEELALCQRYYEVLAQGDVANDGVGLLLGNFAQYSNLLAIGIVPYKVQKRALPTGIVVRGNAFRVYSNNASVMSTAVTVDTDTSITKARIDIEATGTQGSSVWVRSQSTSCLLAVDSEL